MDFVARFLSCIMMCIGWLSAPIYAAFTYVPPKLLPKPNKTNILNLSVTELAEKIRKRELSSEQIVQAFIERCRDVNGQLNAIVEDRFVEALEDAKRVDVLLANGTRTLHQMETETPLLGVPCTIKESCKLDGLSYCVGTKMRVGIKADADGIAVANLRKAGAIPIAVTNTPELCTALETLNFVTGYTCNPYNLLRTSGGSSGGEAALISSASSPLGIGSDFAGSIRIPCMFTGIFGHKPTAGIISNEGHYPNLADKEYQKLLTIGPICRHAKDLKLALKVIGDFPDPSVLDLDTPVDFRNLKIYFARERGLSLIELSVNMEIKQAIKSAVNHFKLMHGSFTKELELPQFSDALEISLAQNTEVENLLGIFNQKGENETLGTDGVLIFPTFVSGAFHKYQYTWKMPAIGYPMIVNILGFPATQIPAGLHKGLPIGFQVIAAPKQDRLCLSVAEELEKVFGGWIPPPHVP